MNNNNLAMQLFSDYVDYRLRKTGFKRKASESPTPTSEPTAVMLALRRLSDEFEVRYTRTFDELDQHIVVTQDNAYETFVNVVNELFIDGIKWGRIVGLFSFTAKLALQAMEKEDEELVNNLIEWATEYVSLKLQPWITQHGGWEGLVDFCGGSGSVNDNERNWPSWSRLCSYVPNVQALCRAIIQNT